MGNLGVSCRGYIPIVLSKFIVEKLKTILNEFSLDRNIPTKWSIVFSIGYRGIYLTIEKVIFSTQESTWILFKVHRCTMYHYN